MKKVYVFTRIPGVANAIQNQLLRINSPATILSDDWSPLPTPEVARKLSEADVLVLDGEFFGKNVDLLRNAQWVQLTWAGVDPIFTSWRTEGRKKFPTYPVTRYSGQHITTQMAEYVVGQIISKERDFPKMRTFQADKYWGNAEVKNYRAIADLNVCILGTGRIGSEVAKMLKIFGATVCGIRNTQSKPEELSTREDFDEVRNIAHLSEALQSSDYLVSILPNTPQTTNLLGNNVLESCKKKPVLINVGRGTIIREKDLAEAIEKGWISGAILDVFETEPLPETSILWSIPQVTITPHVSATSRPQDVASYFVENYKRFMKGHDPTPLIDWQKGY